MPPKTSFQVSENKCESVGKTKYICILTFRLLNSSLKQHIHSSSLATDTGEYVHTVHCTVKYSFITNRPLLPCPRLASSAVDTLRNALSRILKKNATGEPGNSTQVSQSRPLVRLSIVRHGC